MREVEVAIIGAGSAGLSARREVAAVTQNYVVIDPGVTGTTCARVGCMPSKALIEAAAIFHSRTKYAQIGVSGEESLELDTAKVMAHVRRLRDRFVRAVRQDMEEWTADHLLRKKATFADLNILDLGDEKIRAKSIIIATGSRPIVPQAWQPFSDQIVTSDEIFELEKLPRRVGVIGLGVIGLELGQALSRLGVDVVGVGRGKALGGLSDEVLQDYALAAFREEFSIYTDPVDEVSRDKDGTLRLKAGGQTLSGFDLLVVTIGRSPNTRDLGLKDLVETDAKGIPIFDRGTYRIGSTSLFLVGDVNNDRPVLHEASDEGRIAGYNAVRAEAHCFKRRAKLVITFSDPQIAVVGQSHRELVAAGVDFVSGEVSYEGQGRAITKLAEKGLVHVYAAKKDGALLGAEIFAPQGEHLAHLLAWALAAKFTVSQTLSLPFYHPVLEEGLRTALRSAAAKTDTERSRLEVLRCQDPLVGTQLL